MDARELKQRCTDIEGKWSNRNAKFKDWYELILQKDKLAQEDMESFVGNDPRTYYNVAVHMLATKITHRIPSENLDSSEIGDATEIEAMLDHAWKQIDRIYRFRGKQSWMWNFVSLMLATGWYSVFHMATDAEIIAEVWHPAEVYPEFDDGGDGLVLVTRTYSVTLDQAKRKAALGKWTLPQGLAVGNRTLRNVWWYDGGKVMHAVLLDNEFVKSPKPGGEPFDEIPVLVSPVGGLPDTGAIMKTKVKGEDWTEHWGEGVVATNEKMYDQYNRSRSWSNQLLRDTANPRWFERSQGGDILRPEDMFKRGAIFRGGPGDEIMPLPVPALPIEIRTDRFDDQAMIQRGSISWALQGNIQGQMSGYLWTQMASQIQGALKPYLDAIIAVTSEMDNSSLKYIKRNKFKPYGIGLPTIKDNYEVDTTYDIKVPGDLIQRATVARMLDPEFRMATTTVSELLFPEIKDPQREQAKVRKDQAMMHPLSIMVNQITAFKQKAMEIRKAGRDDETARLYEKAAAALEAQIAPEPAPAPTPTPAGPISGAMGAGPPGGVPGLPGGVSAEGLPITPPGVV